MASRARGSSLEPALFWLMAALTLPVAQGHVRADAGVEACIEAHEEAQVAQHSQALQRAQAAALRCAQPDCPAALRSECVALHASLTKSLPSVVFVVRSEAGRDLPEARVELGSALHLARLDGRAHTVDPGVYTLRVQASGFAPYETELVVHTAEHERVLHVQLAPLGTARSTSAAWPIGWALSGVGAAALAVGAGFGIAGLVQKRCADTCSEGEADALRRNLLLGDVLAPAGGALLITGLILQLWPRRASTALGSWRPGVGADPSSITVVGHGAF